MFLVDERVEDCSDSHHSRPAGAIPATPANESLPSEKDRDSQKSGCACVVRPLKRKRTC